LEILQFLNFRTRFPTLDISFILATLSFVPVLVARGHFWKQEVSQSHNAIMPSRNEGAMTTKVPDDALLLVIGQDVDPKGTFTVYSKSTNADPHQWLFTLQPNKSLEFYFFSHLLD
jgi:hypothetical protein